MKIKINLIKKTHISLCKSFSFKALKLFKYLEYFLPHTNVKFCREVFFRGKAIKQ